MLNMKFAEMMELTENELMEVRGGNSAFGVNKADLPGGVGGWGTPGIYPGWGGRGLSPHTGPFDWSIEIGIGFAKKRYQ